MPILAALLALSLQAQDGIRLLVRADDMGAAQAVNEGCLKSCVDGIARSVEVIVPGPWYPQAVRLLKDKPDIDVGVHLCLTSEWEDIKWRPLSGAASLADARGYFFPMTRQRPDFPPRTGFLDASPKTEDVERELRAQIETVKRDLPQVSHLTSHMGAAVSTPEFRALVERLAVEYGLPLDAKDLKPLRGFGGAGKSAEQKEADLAALLEKLENGAWLLVEHPAVDGPESRSLGHLGYTNVAEDRAGVLRAFTSPKVKEVVRSRGIRLIAYRDLR
jgi:chitin disaccharide deacetylase